MIEPTSILVLLHCRTSARRRAKRNLICIIYRWNKTKAPNYNIISNHGPQSTEICLVDGSLEDINILAAVCYTICTTTQYPCTQMKIISTKTPVRFRILWWRVFSLDILYPFPVPGEEMGNYSTIFDLSVYLYSWVSFTYRYKYFTMKFPVIIFRLNIDAFLDLNGICDVYNFIQWVL